MAETGPSKLTAVSPLDGRYWRACVGVSSCCSDLALIRERVRVEVEYFIALCSLPLPQLSTVPKECFPLLRAVYEDFGQEEAARVQEIEAVTNHDVKAVEYYVKEALQPLVSRWEGYSEFVHFALTSQDINNTAIPSCLRRATLDVYLPRLDEVVEQLRQMAAAYMDVPMLARTHGQAATPTRVGKELMVFVERLSVQRQAVAATRHTGKFGGATGQFNAHAVAFPDVDWPAFADKLLLEQFSLDREQYTTQISHYDQLAALFHAMQRVNTILLDLCRDIWTYISLDYFKLKTVATEVGSSAMPHKVNPIDFENAEGNLGMANAVFAHLAGKLPVSRLQRDLSDSTVLRNTGVPLGHTMVAFGSVLRGCKKLSLNGDRIAADLEENWVVVSEAIQTILRREAVDQPYEQLKAATRGRVVTRESMEELIRGLGLAPALCAELLAVTPHNFVGVVPPLERHQFSRAPPN